MSAFDLATAILALLFSAVGLMAVGASVANSEWFFSSENARMLTGRMSRRSARVLYLLAGLAISGCGIYLFGLCL